MPMSDVIGCHKSPCPVAPRDECITQLAHHLNSQFHSKKKVQNSFFSGQVFAFFFDFLSWYHLPCICNSLEPEPVILHGICYILAWSRGILHGICYIWQCSPSILHGIATFWHFNLSFVWYLLHFGTSNVHERLT